MIRLLRAQPAFGRSRRLLLTACATMVSLLGAPNVVNAGQPRLAAATTRRPAAVAPGAAKRRYTTHIDRTTRKRIRYHTLAAPELGKRFRYMVYLPKEGIVAGKKYPLLVLLHGLGEYPHGWITLGKIHELVDQLVESGKMPAPILAMPSGKNGYWTNWADGRHPYGDLVVRRYMDDLHRLYPIARRAELTAIAGCSMGGFGALSLGLRHPEQFGFVVALSPTDMQIALEQSPRRPLYRSIVGPAPSRINVARINPRNLVQRGYGSPQQRFLAVYGAREGRKFGEGTERVAHAMRLRGLNVEVLRVERAGHGWKSAWARSHPWWVSALAQHWAAAERRFPLSTSDADQGVQDKPAAAAGGLLKVSRSGPE